MAIDSTLLAWPTAGRRNCLLESIDGLAKNAAQYGHSPSFLVATDGEDEGLVSGLVEGLKEIESRYGIRIDLSNRRSREVAIDRLSACFDRELLEYALLPCSDGPGWGVNVNASMLAASGRILVSSDDDVFCRPARQGIGTDVKRDRFIHFSREYQNGDLLYYPSRESLLSTMAELEVDVLGSYEALLGARPEGRVLAACPGMYGDSAMGSSRSILSLEGRSREALMDGGYEALRLSRELVRIAPQTTVSTGAQLIMTQTAFDTRVAIPPFMPYSRNPDGLCAVLTRLIYPDSLTAYLDFGLYHAPPEPRLADHFNLTGYRPALSELIMALSIFKRPAKAIMDPAERFNALGSALGSIATLTNADFVELVHMIWSRRLSAYVENLKSLLEHYSRSPTAWALDVDEHIDAVNAVLREPSALFGPSGCGLSIERVKHHIRLYGALLAAWPEMLKTPSLLS